MKKIVSLLLVFVMMASTIIGIFPPLNVNAETEKTYVKRYTVLVLDTSGTVTFSSGGLTIYEADPALKNVKKAAKHFLTNIEAAEGENYVAVVSYEEDATVVSDFSKNMSKVSKEIDDLYAGGKSNISAGLEAAENLINSIDDEDAIKNVVLCTTGLTWSGNYSYDGKYDDNIEGSDWVSSSTDINLYAYANYALQVADRVKDTANLYVLGLFQTLDKMPDEGMEAVRLFQKTALDLASSDSHYHNIEDIDNIEFVFGELAETIVSDIKGTFKYRPGDDDIGKDLTATFYYQDSYFATPARSVRMDMPRFYGHFATMSLCLELAAFASIEATSKGDYVHQSQNAKQLLDDIGFKKIETNEAFKSKPTTDSIGVIIAQKQIKVKGETYTVLAVAIRGGGYEAEWAGNFNVGYGTEDTEYCECDIENCDGDGNHYGFYLARNEAIKTIKEYISDYSVSGKVKLWVTGYSRGGATSGLVGKWFDDHLEEVNDWNIQMTLDDIYAFAFEAPMSTNVNNMKMEYRNIYNIVNVNDLVPKVAMKEWGFARPGDRLDGQKYTFNNLILGEKTSYDYKLKKQNMEMKLDTLLPDFEYDVDEFSDMDLNWFDMTTQPEFLNELSKDFADRWTRKYFVENIQTPLMLIMEKLKGGTVSLDKENLIMGLVDDLCQYAIKIFTKYCTKTLSAADLATISQECGDSIVENLINVGLIEKNDKQSQDAVREVLKALLQPKDISNPPLAGYVIVIGMQKVFDSHRPEVCLAWLMSVDTYYEGNSDKYFSSPISRCIKINCPVNITVLDENGQTVAVFIDDVLQNPDGTDIYAYVRNGEKVIYLPMDGEYFIQITATAEGTMSYTVEEVSVLDGEVTRSVTYLDIPLGEGKTFDAVVPKDSFDSAEDPLVYPLSAEGEDLVPDVDVTDEQVESVICDVEVNIDGEQGGFITGAGEHLIGTRAHLTAQPFDCYLFDGWYSGDEKLSDVLQYSFVVKEDVSVTAKFVPNHTPETDDGDCTTAVICSVCGFEITAVQNHLWDNACDTECNNIGCNFVRNVTHTPNADDGDCTTAITCSVCGEEITAAQKHVWDNEKDQYCNHDGCDEVNPNYKNIVDLTALKELIDNLADRIGITSDQFMIACGSLLALLLLIIIISSARSRRRRY